MSIPELQQADNGNWYLHWSEGGRSKRVSTRTRDLAAAKAFLGQWLLMEKEAPAQKSDIGLTCAELWALYVKKHEVAAEETRRISGLHLMAHFGALLPAQIDQDRVDAYVEKREEGEIGRPSKPSTARRELLALRASWGWAASPKHKQKLLRPEAVPQFDLPPAGEARDRWLTQEEIARLMTSARAFYGEQEIGRVELFLWLALETAARKTAILELEWDRVDFETNVIRYKVPGVKATSKKRADVPISSRLRPILLRAREAKSGATVVPKGGDVWSTIQSIAWRAGFGPRQKVGTGQKPKATGVSPHVLRHTAATHMARRGVPLWVIAGILGNTVQMIQNVYGHHSPDGLRGGVEMISGGLAEAAE